MDKQQTVIGSYKSEGEAIKVVKRLQTEGYSKDEITLFTNQERSDSLKNPEHVDVAEPSINGNDVDQEEDKNFWESIKDAFKVREDHHFDNPDYTKDDDLLHRYRDNLAAGEIVVAVHNFRADRSGDGDTTNHSPRERTSNEFQDMSQASKSAGSIAGFPAENSVTGMTAGGNPPLEPEQSEGAFSDLKNDADRADIEKSRKDQTRQSDENL